MSNTADIKYYLCQILLMSNKGLSFSKKLFLYHLTAKSNKNNLVNDRSTAIAMILPVDAFFKPYILLANTLHKS